MKKRPSRENTDKKITPYINSWNLDIRKKNNFYPVKIILLFFGVASSTCHANRKPKKKKLIKIFYAEIDVKRQ